MCPVPGIAEIGVECWAFDQSEFRFRWNNHSGAVSHRFDPDAATGDSTESRFRLGGDNVGLRSTALPIEFDYSDAGPGKRRVDSNDSHWRCGHWIDINRWTARAKPGPRIVAQPIRQRTDATAMSPSLALAGRLTDAVRRVSSASLRTTCTSITSGSTTPMAVFAKPGGSIVVTTAEAVITNSGKR